MEPWEKELAERLAEFHDQLSYEKARSLDQERRQTGRNWNELSDEDQAAFRELADRRGAIPWADVTSEERDSYREFANRELQEDMDAAFGSAGVLGTSKDARAAVLRLIAWDHRYLQHPSVVRLLRNAQIANDRELLKKVGHNLAQNERYGGRGMRKQRRMSRVLAQLAFGDPNAYADNDYVEKVYQGLYDIYHEARVPDGDPGWTVLTNREYFRKHLGRIGLLPKKQ
ncbi:MAG: hypothetical protein MJE77_07220 [Proteobacteria bacterium]|nr:hypothetical protein [Pseudomonadota bacterium]